MNLSVVHAALTSKKAEEAGIAAMRPYEPQLWVTCSIWNYVNYVVYDDSTDRHLAELTYRLRVALFGDDAHFVPDGKGGWVLWVRSRYEPSLGYDGVGRSDDPAAPQFLALIDALKEAGE